MISRQRRAVTFLLATLLISAPGIVGAQSYEAVTDERLEEPEAENWLSYRGNYAGWGYSPLDQIDASNVTDLVPVWSFSTGVGSGHEAPPIVNGGMMFVATPENQLLALDAVSGDLVWRYQHELPENLVAFHNTNRGVALFGDRVFMATLDARVLAFDALSGDLVWDASVADNSSGYYMTLAPLVARGKVMVGASGGELGIRGFVVALDTETGSEVWRTHTVPAPGEPGNDSWPGDAWRTGGAAVWLTGHYDPALGLTYWGTGNPGPWIGDQRPGDNLYSNSVLALDVDTGEIHGHHQYHWNGSWDWDEVSTPLLVDVLRDGRMIPALVHPGRNGYLWILERQRDGIRFVDAEPFVYQNVFTSIDPETGRPTYDETRKPGTERRAEFCPSLWGGKDWPPAAYKPGYAPSLHSGQQQPLRSDYGERARIRPGPLVHGRLVGDDGARGSGSHRRAAGLGPRPRREGLDAGVRVSQLGAGPHDGGGSGLRGRDARPILPRISCPHRRTALGASNELGGDRRTRHLRGGRRAVRRRSIGVGRGRGLDDPPDRRGSRHQHFRPPRGGDLGLFPEGVALTRPPEAREVIERLGAPRRKAPERFHTLSSLRVHPAPEPTLRHCDRPASAPAHANTAPSPTPGRGPGHHPTRHWPSQRIWPPKYTALPGARKPKISSYPASPAFSTRTRRSRPGRPAPGVRTVAPRPRVSTT